MMKKFYLFFILGLVFGVLFSRQVVVHAELPPDFASSFYGQIHFIEDDNGPIVGDIVYAYVPGVTTPVASSQIVTGDGWLWYKVLSVPADDPSTTDIKEGGLSGETVTFKINANDRIIATGTWQSGTNQRLDFHPPKADAGGPYNVYVNQTIGLSGSATDWLAEESLFYNWDLNEDGIYDDLSGENPTTSFASDGIYTIGLKVTDSQGGEGFATTTVTVTKTNAIVELSNLEYVYDGAFHYANATTIPEDLNVIIEYDNGLITDPMNAGSYAVVATIDDPAYQGFAEGTLIISPAPAEITITSNLEQDYDGSSKTVTATTDPTLLDYSVTYNEQTEAPSATGAYSVVATITNPNYVGSTSGTLVIRATHNIPLVSGWNLISFNLQPYPSKAPADVFASIADNYDLVYAWDATGASSANGNWMIFDPDISSPDTLEEIDENLGLWIHVTSASTLSVKGFMPTTTTINLLTTGNGWNLVGFPSSLSPAPAVSFTDSTNVSLVYAYDPSDVNNPWKLYQPGIPDYVIDLASMQAGFGYWVLVTAEDTWNVAY
jgi:hypothetical protein